jgi:hypothetical protein
VLQRHDPFLKLLRRRGAEDAVRLFFPALAERIDWAGLRWIEKEIPILGQQPRAVVADLVGLTRDTEGRELEILIHPEIQMEADPAIGWRVLQYNAGLTLQQANPNARVLTFVFYHCRGGGGVRRARHELEFYGEPTLGVGYWNIGLGELDARRYAEQPNPMAWALASWMRQQRRGRALFRIRLQERIIRSVTDEHYRWMLLNTVRTYFWLSPEEAAEEERLAHSKRSGEDEEMFEGMLHTELGRLEEEARRRGWQEGRQEGLEEGLERGCQTGLQGALLSILRARFPASMPQVEARIRQLDDLALLDNLIQRAATAASLEEIGIPLD